MEGGKRQGGREGERGRQTEREARGGERQRGTHTETRAERLGVTEASVTRPRQRPGARPGRPRAGMGDLEQILKSQCQRNFAMEYYYRKSPSSVVFRIQYWEVGTHKRARQVVSFASVVGLFCLYSRPVLHRRSFLASQVRHAAIRLPPHMSPPHMSPPHMSPPHMSPPRAAVAAPYKYSAIWRRRCRTRRDTETRSAPRRRRRRRRRRGRGT